MTRRAAHPGRRSPRPVAGPAPRPPARRRRGWSAPARSRRPRRSSPSTRSDAGDADGTAGAGGGRRGARRARSADRSAGRRPLRVARGGRSPRSSRPARGFRRAGSASRGRCCRQRFRRSVRPTTWTLLISSSGGSAGEPDVEIAPGPVVRREQVGKPLGPGLHEPSSLRYRRSHGDPRHRTPSPTGTGPGNAPEPDPDARGGHEARGPSPRPRPRRQLRTRAEGDGGRGTRRRLGQSRIPSGLVVLLGRLLWTCAALTAWSAVFLLSGISQADGGYNALAWLGAVVAILGLLALIAAYGACALNRITLRTKIVGPADLFQVGDRRRRGRRDLPACSSRPTTPPPSRCCCRGP